MIAPRAPARRPRDPDAELARITVRSGGTDPPAPRVRARRREPPGCAPTGALRDRTRTGLHGPRIAVAAAVIATALNRSPARNEEAGAAIRPSMNDFLARRADNRLPDR